MPKQHSNLPAAPPATSPQREGTREEDWTIAMSVDVNADARRIFHALTVPEYLEAWVAMPGRNPGATIVAARTANGYSLEARRDGRVDVSIRASYLFCHQRKMRLAWRKETEPFSQDSKVDVRLRGNFGSTILELEHSALASSDECLWHQHMWRASLERLQFLLRSG